MTKSMTGFGRAIAEVPNKKITVEIKALNSKQVDLNVKMPSFYREKEMDIRDRVAKQMLRGKIDLSIYIEITGESKAYSLNADALKAYMRDLQELSTEQISNAELIQMALKLPETVKQSREELDPEEWKVISDAVDQAIEAAMQYRTDEGKSLEEDILSQIAAIADLLNEIPPFEQERKDNTRQKLHAALEQGNLKDAIDKDRFEQELIFYLEKYDINEEKVRLKNHLSYFEESMKDGVSGKKLGFIAQEIGREVNTIGSKANHAEIQKIVVNMKDALERIKEQVLNVL